MLMWIRLRNVLHVIRFSAFDMPDECIDCYCRIRFFSPPQNLYCWKFVSMNWSDTIHRHLSNSRSILFIMKIYYAMLIKINPTGSTDYYSFMDFASQSFSFHCFWKEITTPVYCQYISINVVQNGCAWSLNNNRSVTLHAINDLNDNLTIRSNFFRIESTHFIQAQICGKIHLAKLAEMILYLSLIFDNKALNGFTLNS